MTAGSGWNVPRNALFATLTALALGLLLFAMDQASRDCGDGLCGSIIGSLAAIGLALASFFFVFRGLMRGETPRWWFALPVLFWLFMLPALFS